MTTARGRFVTLEGVEGSGKSSLLQGLADHLRGRGVDVVTTREPGGTPLAEQLRTLLLARGPEPLPPTAELLLMFAARAIHLQNLVRPALEAGRWVLCDRFTDASIAYQGGGRGLPRAHIDALAGIVHATDWPDLTLLLDVDPVLGLTRARRRGDGGDRFEDEAVAFFGRVRATYLQLATDSPLRFRVLDAAQPQAAVLAAACQAADALLAAGQVP